MRPSSWRRGRTAAEHDRVAGPAVRAVDVRIAIARVRRIEQLTQAAVAHRQIGRDGGGRLVLPAARPDHEAVQSARLGGIDIDGGDARRLGRLRAELAEEPFHPLVVALELDLDALAVVQHPAGQRVRARQPIDERPEADSLHHAADADRAGAGHPGLLAHRAAAALPADLHHARRPRRAPARCAGRAAARACARVPRGRSRRRTRRSRAPRQLQPLAHARAYRGSSTVPNSSTCCTASSSSVSRMT